MENTSFWGIVLGSLCIVAFLTICIYSIIYYTTVGQNKVLRGLDLILLKLRRDNLIVTLKSLPEKITVEQALQEVRGLEKALDKPEKNFDKELEEYYKLKAEVDERGYI